MRRYENKRTSSEHIYQDLRTGVSSATLAGILSTTALIAIIFFSSLWVIHEFSVSLRQKRILELQAIASLKGSQISDWREHQLAGVRLFTSGWVRRLAEELQLATDTASITLALAQRLIAFRDTFGYQDLFLTTATGSLLFSTNPSIHKLTDSTTELITHAAATNTALMGEPYLCPLCSNLHLEVAMAVRTDNNALIAVCIARIDPHVSLFPLIQTWPTPSPSAETMVGFRDGNEAVVFHALRHHPERQKIQRIPLTQTDRALVQAVLGTTGIFEGKDYRGIEVIADLSRIPKSSWYMVSKVDKAELLAEIKRLQSLAALFVVLLVVCTSSLAGLAYYARRKKLFEIMYKLECEKTSAQQEFKAILYSIGDGVISTDIDGKITRLNPTAEQLTGWSEADAQGKHITEVFCIIHEETRAPIENPLITALQKQQIIHLTNHSLLVSRDGTERPIVDSGAPVYDDAHNLIGAVLVFRDQTAVLAAERENALLSYAIRSSVNEIYLFDAESLKFRFVNEGALRNLGYSLEQMREMTPLDIKPEHTRESFTRLVAPLLEHKVPLVRFETVHQRADGSRYPVEAHLQLFEHARQRFFLAVIVDVTERKSIERQLHQAQKMESVGNLAGGVAHDFNNMLGVIIGRAEIAQQRLPPDSPVQADLEEILQSAHRSAELTRRLLAFARKQTASPRVIDLNSVIEGMLRMLRRLIGENITLRWQPGNNLWPIRIDPAQIDQILANLVVNARDAITDVGTISLSTENIVFDADYVQTHPEFVQGDYVRLSVSDTGCGMTKEVMSKIFDPFFTTKDVGKGTGLGLAMVYGIVKQNEGFINVYSEPGRGTTFNLYFARSHEKVEPMHTGSTPILATGNETILLVEDEPSLLELGTVLLSRLGYRVITVSSPKQALLRLEQQNEKIDLLITDVVMPEMNGRDLAEAARKIRPNIRVLFMSGYTADVIAHHGVIEAGKSFLQKPFNQQQLATVVRQVLDAPPA